MSTKWCIAFLTAALAAPAIAQAEPSLHGFADLSIKNDYITPRGLRVTSEGSTIHALAGLVVVVPLDPASAVKEVSFVGGTWMDFNPGYGDVNTQVLNEVDWFIGANAKVGDKWTLGAQYVEFISAPGAFKTEKNLEFSVAYADGLKPISINPYAKLFYAMSGDSTVVTGKRGDTYDVEIGMTPTLPLGESGVTLSAPTWITVGPDDYWGGDENFGVFTTGLKVSYALKDIPASAGHWNIYAGYQYYHLINDQLVVAQSILNSGKDDKDLHLFQVGVGLGF
jgi:hypothetical protein